MSTSFSQVKNDDLYGVEIVGKTAYTNYLGDTSPYHAKYRDNDLVDSRANCLAFIASRAITEVYGVLSAHVQ